MDYNLNEEDEKFAFKDKAEEAKVYGLNGCLCIDCINKRILREWHKIQGSEEYVSFKDFLQHAKKEMNIEEIAKRRYGLELRSHKTECPFHDDKEPSLVFYNKTNTYFCFGCGATGDIIEFIEQMENNLKKKGDASRDVTTPQERYEILQRQKWRCNLCGQKLKYSKKHEFGDEVAHIDHIHPYNKRNSYINGARKINEMANKQALCQTCNLKKRDK